jgi:hypothetical protein
VSPRTSRAGPFAARRKIARRDVVMFVGEPSR